MALSEPRAVHRAVDERETGPTGWYASTVEDVLARLSSDRQGLDAGEAARRLAELGPNRLTRQQGPSAWAVLARQFASPLIYALLIAAVWPSRWGTSRTAPWCSGSWCSTR
jgi:magnesium-transporting ATPase (P-type)